MRNGYIFVFFVVFISFGNCLQAENKKQWKLIFSDNFKTSWQQNWFLDGEQAKLENTGNALLFCAGTMPASDLAHSVLWTKKSFEGDLQIEFDFVKRDTATKFVNIIYLFAEGSDSGAYRRDIWLWKDLRRIPAMKIYFNHIRAFHISFAAYENDNSDPLKDYIRARLYRPESGKGLEGTEILPEYLQTGLFIKDEKYHIRITRIAGKISMLVTGENKKTETEWILPSGDNPVSGRIGLRVMGGRISEFANFKVFAPSNATVFP
jgi:hypothetical protein